MQKHLLFYLLFLLLISTGLADTSGYSIKNIQAPITNNHNVLYKKLSKSWISVKYFSRGKEADFRNIYRITLKSDSTFKTIYKPDNYHQGTWSLQNDSSFVLYLKALETFKILEITDSTLKVETEWDNGPTIILFNAYKANLTTSRSLSRR
jgi:hypothetical protein